MAALDFSSFGQPLDSDAPDFSGLGEPVAESPDFAAFGEPVEATPGGEPGFISQTARGFQAGVSGGQSMAAALMTIPAFGAFQSLSNEVAAYDAIDSGQDPEGEPTLGMSPLEDRQRMYKASSPEQREKMRDLATSRIANMTEIRQNLREAWQSYSDEAKAKSGRVANFTDIEDVAGFRDWLGFSIGQGAPYIAATTLAAVLGGAPAVAGTGLAIGAGDIQGELMEAGIEDRGDLALAGAVPYAALEMLGPAGRYLRNVSSATIKEVAKRYFQRLGKEVPANFVEEFVNEAGQGIISDAVVTSQTGEAMVTDESLLRWFNEGMAGGAAGAPMGAVSAVPGPNVKRSDLPPVEITPEDVASPIPTDIIAEGKRAVQEAEAGLPADAVPAETIIGEEKAAAEPAPAPEPTPDPRIRPEPVAPEPVSPPVEDLINSDLPAEEIVARLRGETPSVAEPATATPAITTPTQTFTVTPLTEDGDVQPGPVAPDPRFEGPAIPPAPAEAKAPELDAFGLKPLEEGAAKPVAGDGSPQAPVRVETGEQVDEAAARAEPEPSEAQSEAGNYRMGHVQVAGLDITIERPKDSIRRGTSRDGTEWQVKMPAHYGYVKRTEAADGENFDVYIGPNPESGQVFVVDQIDPKTRKFDEHKALIGFNDQAAAEAAYDAAFSDGTGASRRGAVTAMTIEQFRDLALSGEATKPLAYRPAEALRTKRRAKPAAKSTDDVLTFLARRGGIRDDEGHDLKAGRNLQKFIPKSGPVIRSKGMGIDDAGEALWEAGYFGPPDTTDRPTERQVLDLLERGKAGQVFTPEVQAEKDAESEAAEQAQAEIWARADVRAEASALGEILSKSQTEEVLAAMARDQLGADEAMADYLERRAIRDEGELDSYIKEPSDEARIPFDAPTETGRPAGEEGGSPERAARAGEEGEARREPTEESGRTTGSQAPEVVSEPTDQSGQSVTPGAKKITDKNLAERRMEGRKRSTAAQKPADEGLFGTGAGSQGELLSRRRGVASSPTASNALAISLRERLRKVGIADKVAIQAVTVIHSAAIGKVSPAQGRYFRSLIEVVLDSDQAWVLNHEIIHGLKDMGLLKPAEWRALEKAARADKKRMKEIRERYADLNLSEAELVEEAIADHFADWVAGKSQVKGFLRTAFERLRAFLEALGNALSGNGFHTVADVFGDVDAGIVGRREGRVSEAAPERFSLTPDTPDTAENRQKVMQGFIARGQPLDRALRIPFDWFLGGVNERGEWKPGRKVFDAAEKAITQANFSDTSPFAWLSGTLETARAGLIDRYGLDSEFVKRERKLDLDKRAIAQKGAEILKGLKDSNISPEEARVLQAVLTGEDIADADMKKLAAPIRQAIDELGAEAVSLGLVSPESYERNRGTYLHRVYLKHEGDQPALSKWFSTFMANHRKKIQGSAFKGRGLFLDVTIDRAMRESDDFREGKRGRPVKGESFIVLDKLSQDDLFNSTDGDAAQPAPKIERRVYWPAGKPVPDRFKDFTNRGVWEVRRVLGEKITLWRDFTKSERERMGEVMDARYTIGKTFMLMAQDLSTGRFYKDIATNGDWTRSQEPGGNWVNAGEYRRFRQAPSVEWVKVPDTDIPKTGGKKRWGALAGMYVRAEIWRDLNEIDIMSRPNLWTQLLTQWKLNKTARSPVVHMNNVMSNLVFMDLADVRMQDLVGGLKAYVKQTKDYEEAAANGAFGSDIISQEIRQKVLQPILDDLQKEISGGRNPVLAKAGFLGRLADVIWDKTKALDRKMIDLYRIEDEVFRMATYMRRRSLGDSAEHAADEARQQFLDYDIRAPWVNMARRSVLPFISYTYRAAPVIARSIATRPWKLGKYFAVAYAMNSLGYMLAPGDEDEERRSLRPAERGYTWIGAPRMLRMPYRDSYGNPVFLDIRRWIPAGDIFDINQGHGAFPVPAWLRFGGPLMIGAELALNKSAFTGEEITNDLTDSSAEKFGKNRDFLWKSWVPSAVWIPGSWYWEKVGLAMTGATDSQGRAYPVPEALASSFGIKLKPQDVEANLEWRAYEFEKQRRALKAERRRISRLLDRGHISEESFEEAMESINTKLQRVDEEAAKILK